MTWKREMQEKLQVQRETGTLSETPIIYYFLYKKMVLDLKGKN